MEIGFNTLMTFPVGQMLKKCAPEALSQIFEEAAMIKDGSYPQNVDAVYSRQLKDFSTGTR